MGSSCITCNNRLHNVCFHDAKLTKSKFPNNNSPPKYLIEMFNSPFFNCTCKPCTMSPNQYNGIDKVLT